MNNKISKFKDYLQVTMSFTILELDGWIILKKTSLINILFLKINQIKILAIKNGMMMRNKLMINL
jgi:hypothetical protein